MLLAWALAGCATSVPLPHAPSPTPLRSTLEVANRLPDPARIAVDGQEIGVVDPGERRRFRELRAGERSVWVMAGPLDQVQQVTLTPGAVTPLPLVPLEPETALPAPAPIGHVTLVNQSDLDLEVRVNGGPARTLLARDERTLLDQPAGTRLITVRPPGRRYERQFEVTVVPDVDTRVELALQVGTVRLTNRTGEAVRVLVDGKEVRVVQPNVQTEVTDLVMGLHELVAVGLDTGREHRRTFQIEEGVELPWDLTASEGRLELLNRTGESLAIAIDGVEREPIPAGGEVRYDDVPLGRRSVTARGQDSGHQWVATVPLTAGHQSRWTIRTGGGTAWIVNRLVEPVEIRLDGEVVRTLEPGASTFLGDLPTGTPDLAALATVSEVILRAELTIGPARSAIWEITGPQARLHVRNQMPEMAMVYANGQPLGRVPAGGEVVFTQVPPGERLLEATLEGGATIRGAAEVTLEALAVWDIAASTGRVEVINDTDEPLAAPPTLAAQSPEVAPGGRVIYEVPAGHRILHFIGRDSGLSYYERLTVVKDEQTPWQVKPQVGILHVFNRTAEDQQVRVDSLEPVLIPAGQELQQSLRAGAHAVVAVGQTSRSAVEATVVVRGASTHAWEILPKLAHVRIVNETPEALDLSVQGGPLGFVEPGAVRSYGPWPTGPYHLEARGRWSKAVYEVELTLEAGRVEGWVILPARGAVLVKNERNEPVRVMVDKRTVGRVEAGQEHVFDVALGPHLVELIGVESLAPFVYRPHVRPDRAYTAIAPAGPAQIRVVNKLAVPLTVLVDGQPAGEVPAGAEAGFDLPGTGAFTVLARDEANRRDYHRRVRVEGDRVLQWVIEP